MLYQNVSEFHFTKKEGYLKKVPDKQANLLDKDRYKNSELEKLFFSEAAFCISGTSYGTPLYTSSENAEQYLIYPTSFFDSEFDHEYFTQRQNMASYEIRYTYEGCGLLIYEGVSYSLPPGTGFFIDNRNPHYYASAADKWCYTELHFNGVLVRNIYERFIESGSPLFTDKSCPNFYMYQYEILKKMTSYHPYREYTVSNLFTMLLTDLLTNNRRVGQASGKAPEIVKYTVEYMQEHYSEAISIEELSSSQFISRRHLTREFTRYMGTSPKNYLNRFRLQKAQELLVSTDLTVEEISIRTGFHSDSHFIESFKKMTGLTPLKFRKENS